MKFTILCSTYIAMLVMVVSLNAQSISPDLVLFAGDVRVEEVPDEKGMFLYIRAKAGLKSVMLTESAEVPVRKDVNTYALSTSEYNRYNGDENRILNGKYIRSVHGYFIIDSTPQQDAIFDKVYVLFIPYIVNFGYASTRNGTIDFTKNTNYINIRSFSKPYADYTGDYVDNSFFIKRVSTQEEMVDSQPQIIGTAIPTPPNNVVAQTPIDVQLAEQPKNVDSDTTLKNMPKEASQEYQQEDVEHALKEIFQIHDLARYSGDTLNAFTEIATRSGTKPTYITDSDDIPRQIVRLIRDLPKDQSLDLVLLFDTTRSMWDDMSAIKSSLVPLLKEVLKDRVYRIGIIFYKDFGEVYETRYFEFTDQLQEVQAQIKSAHTTGGGDWPESVHEAMKVAVEDFIWVAEQRKIILVGDAPPHDPPRDDIDVDLIYNFMRSKKIQIHPFLVPIR